MTKDEIKNTLKAIFAQCEWKQQEEEIDSRDHTYEMNEFFFSGEDLCFGSLEDCISFVRVGKISELKMISYWVMGWRDGEINDFKMVFDFSHYRVIRNMTWYGYSNEVQDMTTGVVQIAEFNEKPDGLFNAGKLIDRLRSFQ